MLVQRAVILPLFLLSIHCSHRLIIHALPCSLALAVSVLTYTAMLARMLSPFGLAFFLLSVSSSYAHYSRALNPGLKRDRGQSGLSADLCSWQEVRLPTAVLPRQYNLTLSVQLEEPYLVEGKVDILLNISQPGVRCVVLHSSENIEVMEARLGKDGKRVPWRVNQDLEQLTLEFKDPLHPLNTWLHLAFQYPLSPGLSGLYRSTYMLSDGQERSLATTHFEPTSARKAFPCFDEPAMKAVFVVSIECEAGMTVLSNMPTESVYHHDKGQAIHQFQPSPPMSTYYLAFIVGDLVSVTRTVAPAAGSCASRAVSVWATPNRLGSLDFAADVAATILPAFETLFGVPYALPKLDLVAIPDFAVWAMENWGLVTFDEQALLTSPTSSSSDYRFITSVIGHELVHMWFGDLVTMDSWGDLWLNEGFASYFEFAGATAAFPEQDFLATYYYDHIKKALYFDSLESSHPLSVLEGIDSTDQIRSLYDSVTYSKGGGVLRMLHSWVNRHSTGTPTFPFESTLTTHEKDPFLAGLRQYLSQYSFGTATSADLWASLDEPLGMPDLAEKMQSWTYQKGYPLLTITMDDSGNIFAQQSTFTLQGPSPCNSSTAWWVPLSFTTSSTSGGALQWAQLEGCAGQQPIAKLSEQGDWIKVNAGQYGFYRVQYDAALWQGLVSAVAPSGSSNRERASPLSEVDVAGLLEDSWALSKEGDLNMRVFLDLVSALQRRGGVEYSPWITVLPYLMRIYERVPCPSQWQQYVGEQLLDALVEQAQPQFSFAPLEGLGWPGKQEESEYRLLRPTVLLVAAYFGVNRIKGEALDLMSQLLNNSSDAHIGDDIRSAVYWAAARSNDPEIYQQLKEMYLEADDPDETNRLVSALARAGPEENVMASLDFALQPELSARDAYNLVVRVASNRFSNVTDNRQITWNWLKLHWEELHKKMGGDDEASETMGQMMERVASGFTDPGYLQEVDEMFNKHKVQDAGYAKRTKESIEANARWVEYNGAEVCNWVQDALAGDVTTQQQQE